MDLTVDEAKISLLESLLGPRPPENKRKISNDSAEIVFLSPYEVSMDEKRKKKMSDGPNEDFVGEDSPLGCQQS